VQFVHVLHGEEGTDVAHADEILRGYVTSLAKGAGIPEGTYSGAVVTGSPARAILDFAANAKFIVLSSHGRGGFKAAIIGSVADKVVRGATVPVIFVPAIDSKASLEAGPVLVGLDGSPEAEKGLAAAREVAKRLDLRVVLVRAYTLPPAVGLEFGTYPADILPMLKESAEAYLNQVAHPGEEKYTALDSAAGAVEEGAEKTGAALIVLTSHGKGAVDRLALGSTTDRVMHSVKRPLLVVPVGN
jgi:nucleotide-binding universal stress UspA family protein